MSARDELAEAVYIAGSPSTATDAQYDWNYMQTRTLRAKEKALAVQYRIADAILAAGYSKPRTITTEEELDALPAGTIIRDPLHCIKWGDGRWGTFSGDSVGSNRIDFPATVLYTPEES